MSFQNLYYKRTAGTAKACYVCYRPTTTVLATIDTTDFVYTCPGHLTDPNFAAQVKDNGNSAKRQVTAEEIAKAKEEWEEKQRKKEKEKEAAKAEKEKKDGEKKDGEKESKDQEDKKEKKEEGPSSAAKTPSAPATPGPTHERYILHRDFFAMRQAEHRKRRQTAQAKELAPRLPGAPSGSVV